MRAIVIALLLLGSFSSFAQKKKKEITPKKYLAKVKLTGKNEYTYYALSEKNRTEFRVEGPGKLHINVRVRIQDQGFSSEPFKIKYLETSKSINIIEVPALISSNLKFKSNSLTGNPTRSHRIVIDIPPGKHQLRFYKYKTDQRVHLRAFYEKHTTPKWKDLTPTSTAEKKKVRFVKSGKMQDYYRIAKKEDFNFSISDTAQMRVIVRPEFTYRMLNETLLKVRLTNITTGEIKVYKVSSTRSKLLEFVDDKKHALGASRIFYINLKKPLNGSDQYSLSLVSGAKGAVVRLSNNTTFLK